jgi:hypothetical protein
MKEIRFTSYFKRALADEKNFRKVAVEVIRYAEQRFYDRSSGRLVAVKNTKISKRRSLQFMLAYEEIIF